MAAFYSENDPGAAAWLRELMRDGLIPEGVVDERSIVDVRPADLRGFAQVHLFAGIGGWPRALRLAGWGDADPIWTGSCPCPPFSSAGKKKRCPGCGGRPIPCPRRTGFFICIACEHAWLADERHLWPEVWRLVAECRPTVLVGEQVAGGDGRVWFAGVRGSLEVLGYAAGSADLPAASVGAPHIRQRIYWIAEPVAHAHDAERGPDRRGDSIRGGAGGQAAERAPGGGGDPLGLADTDGRQPGDRGLQPGGEHGQQPADGGAGRGMGDADSEPRSQRDERPEGGIEAPRRADAARSGFWDDTELVHCRDGKSRRIPRQAQPGVQPVADGVPDELAAVWAEIARGHPLSAAKIPGRTGLLRGAGNAIVPAVGAAFIRAYLATQEEESGRR